MTKPFKAYGALRGGVLALCVLALVLSALPLYVIAFDNHPYYDDFGFSAPVHDVWLATGSLSATFQAAVENAKAIRQSWQGTYTGTLLSNLQPGVFKSELYSLCAVFLLTTFIGGFWFFLATAFGEKGLGLERRQTAMLACLTLSLLIQFMPDTGEAFFWFNGGVGNVFVYALLAVSAALFLRLYRAQTAAQKGWLMAALLPCMALLGGGSYGGGLFGLCGLLCVILWLFARRKPVKWLFLAQWLVFLGGFLYSASAPGNGVRASVIGYQGSAVKAVAQSLYYGTAMMGTWLKLPLLGVTALVLPAFWQAARQRPLKGRALLIGSLLGAGLYCAQLTPPLYSGVFIGGGRIVNTYWISFVVLWLLFVYGLLAVLAGRRSAPMSRRCRQGLAAFGAALVLLGGLGYRPSGNTLYGVQNMAGVSAAISLLNGEAARYDREMSAREALLEDDTKPEVTLAPLTATPQVFMDDLLVQGAVYDVRPSLMAYYHKTAITLEGEGATP